ncbi:hypothetical protein HBB16_06550 [Pseudonocardia sp. MCCB 268]|nr:hypothetical protein [Pseudonocardia cytotoxica]
MPPRPGSCWQRGTGGLPVPEAEEGLVGGPLDAGRARAVDAAARLFAACRRGGTRRPGWYRTAVLARPVHRAAAIAAGAGRTGGVMTYELTVNGRLVVADVSRDDLAARRPAGRVTCAAPSAAAARAAAGVHRPGRRPHRRVLPAPGGLAAGEPVETVEGVARSRYQQPLHSRAGRAAGVRRVCAVPAPPAW